MAIGTAEVSCYSLHMTETLIGRTYNRLTVTGPATRASDGKTRWTCTCACGSVGVVVRASELRTGRTKSCGCLRREAVAARNRNNAVSLEDLLGTKFGRLTIVAEEERSSRNARRFRCSCECGSSGTVTELAHLRSGSTQSCGCLQVEATQKANTTHGKRGSSLYIAWRNMLNRVTNPDTKGYENYGGRGISVCPEWYDVAAFERDMGPSHSPGMTLERIDVNGNYEPSNCTWADRTTQARNRRTTWRIEFRGQTRAMAEWCDFLSLNYTTVRRRIRQLGWSTDRALITGANPEALAALDRHGESNG